MKKIFCMALPALFFLNAVLNAQINPVPLTGAVGDDIPTIVYDPAGRWWFEHPSSENGAAALTTLELTSASDFFEGIDTPPNWISGLFDVYNAKKAFKLDPGGFTSLEEAPAVPNLTADEVSKLLTVNGSFAGGSALQADLRIVPEPSSLVLLGFSGLLALRRRRH